jgi:hypothetical protein
VDLGEHRLAEDHKRPNFPNDDVFARDVVDVAPHICLEHPRRGGRLRPTAVNMRL